MHWCIVAMEGKLVVVRQMICKLVVGMRVVGINVIEIYLATVMHCIFTFAQNQEGGSGNRQAGGCKAESWWAAW